MGAHIELPLMLTAEVDSGLVSSKGIWYDRHFIVLKFGEVEVTRWEFQPDRPVNQRATPDDWDVADFVAAKLRSLFVKEDPDAGAQAGP